MKQNNLALYNSLTRSKQLFVPIHPGKVGMYVCGPTVYGDGHLGHARPAITFDVLYRYLTHLGYKVRYVRNITDVGHLEHDADSGEDKVAKKARLEQLEPMEVVQHYLNRYHDAMARLNVLPPSIEPHASGHIIEQIDYIKKILESGYAYESEGSVYFDGQQEKRNPADFALWKKAAPEHIMHWPSPWSEGFPGWHLECSVMSEKYLGEPFDIHGGGMDLKFPHHECEIAQSVAHNGHDAVRYWMHNNMITINGQKMGKSLGTFITLDEFFSGSHPLLQRMLEGRRRLEQLKASDESTVDVAAVESRCYEALDDDLNTPVVIAALFDACGMINRINDGHDKATQADIDALRRLFDTFLGDILGVTDELGAASAGSGARLKPFEDAVELLLQIRAEAKAKKDWATSDLIRDRLKEIGFNVKDTRDGWEWSLA